MFNLSYVAANLGVNVERGGISVVEEELTVSAAGGSVTTSKDPIAFDGVMIGWYKKPSDADWSIGTLAGKTMSIPGSKANEHYCVKYFYQNENAKSITIKAQYVPKVLHLVLINDLFSGSSADVASSSSKYGRLITDIPNYQLSGEQSLEWSATSTASVSLSGNALAYASSDSCEVDPIYGTMTQEIFGADWKDDVVALAVETQDIELSANETETAIVRAVFGGMTASQRKDNSNFTFTVDSGDSATVSASGVITADATKTGVTTIEVTLTNHPSVPAAYIKVTVA